MELNQYQKLSRRTAIYPKIGRRIVYPTLGLTDEAGEVAGKIKKIFRDKNGRIGKEDKEAVAKELGDVLWYLAQLATELGCDLDEIAKDNLAKLDSRKKRGKLGGSGDNR